MIIPSPVQGLESEPTSLSNVVSLVMVAPQPTCEARTFGVIIAAMLTVSIILRRIAMVFVFRISLIILASADLLLYK